MRKLYESEGAFVVEGGTTLNPSTDEILAAINSVAADQVIVLPEQRQRDHGRRAGSRAFREDREGGRIAVAAGRACLHGRAQL